jgi:hypothetical protein
MDAPAIVTELDPNPGYRLLIIVNLEHSKLQVVG